MTDQKKSYSRRNFISNFANATAVFTIINNIPFLGKKNAYANTSIDLFLPTQFPSQIEITKSSFENWSGEIYFSSIWLCYPKSADEIVIIANWAKDNGYKVRARGKMHNWSPLAIGPKQSPKKILFVDLTKYLKNAVVDKQTTPQTITAQTGITMESMLTILEKNGLGLTATPAPGVLTLGGVLAINGHGTAIPALNETATEGHAYGSVSNLILSLTAVVWDTNSNQYILKKFQRNDPDCAAFLVHIGRSFITEVTLQAGENQLLRCQSFMKISADELFGAPNSSNWNLQNFLNETGRIEAILFPFTDKPWIKVWSVVKEEPGSSCRKVTAPYNYPFTDNLSQETSNLVSNMMTWNPSLTPLFGKLQYEITEKGLKTEDAMDIYGWSKNMLLYIKPTTLHVTANGYAIVTNRNNVQQVIFDFYSQFKILIEKYESQHKYPMNGPIEIRVTGLDKTDHILNDSAVTPYLSALRPDPEHPEWDVAVWLDVLTIPGTRHSNEFYQEMENWIFSHYVGSYATARAEWSKGWGYTKDAAWANPEAIARIKSDAAWTDADKILAQYDPYRLFSSDLLDKILG